MGENQAHSVIKTDFLKYKGQVLKSNNPTLLLRKRIFNLLVGRRKEGLGGEKKAQIQIFGFLSKSDLLMVLFGLILVLF